MNSQRSEDRRASDRVDCPNFDRLASLYRWMEMASFGPFLQGCRCTWLSDLITCRRALILGDGDGRFAARFLRVNRTVTIDAVDASPAMLRALVNRVGAEAHRVTTHIADARRWQPPSRPYDLIVTHFFLDCLTSDEVRSLAETVRRAACDRALWVVSEFAIPESSCTRFIARPLVDLLYLAFRWLTCLRVNRLPDHGAALRDAGFSVVRRRTSLGGLLVSELWSVRPGQLSDRE